ncbi:hypothetical protein RJ639_033330 [Escallonia herrerae]|uniref:Pentatricopeptide repeat-containing protein n=1 Tax=Escallonia herrerae TaxID=1293975 RepID=A0AA88WWZ7_9ASTE|nr:hypothetical protein RJ639_033330 [Escallonia herrerae]
MASLGRSRISLPSQFSASFSFPRKIAVCLTSRRNASDTVFFRDGSYVLLPNVDASNLLSYTPLFINPEVGGVASSDYFIGVKSVKVNKNIIPINAKLLSTLADLGGFGEEEDGKSGGKERERDLIELDLNSFVSNCLVNLYGKCGLLKSARVMFDTMLEPNQVSWASLISCSCQCGENLEGLKIFLRSRNAGVRVNEVCCATVLGACTALEYLKLGKQLHSLAVKCGIRMDQFVVTGLVNFYVKCGESDSAHRAFWEVDKPHFTAWTALIAGCVHSGKGRKAINNFVKMHSSGMQPSEITFSSVFGAFAEAKEIEIGKQVHSLIIKSGFSSFTFVGNAVLAFYSKSGFLEGSLRTFKEMDARDVVTWNTLIAGHVYSGLYQEAVELLRSMMLEGPDHLACMVSIFGRKGQTKGAYKFISSFPGEPDKVVWRCLLSSCKAHKDLELGKIAAENILRTDPDDTSAHIMLSNIYAELKMWNETADIRRLIKEKTLKKDPGYSWTELKNKIYSFSAGHNVYYQGNNVPEVLNGLTAQLYDEGYAPDAMLVLQNEE